jgi:hypothetical protein
LIYQKKIATHQRGDFVWNLSCGQALTISGACSGERAALVSPSEP